MSEHRIPRAGSVARIALTKLQQLGGVASAAEWLAEIDLRISPRQFDDRVTSPLIRHGYVHFAHDEYEVTDAGRSLLGDTTPKAPKADLQIATPRIAHSFKPLQRSSKSAIVYRDGAFDYRTYPSLAGDQRLPYKSGADMHGTHPLNSQVERNERNKP